ncbi:MAG: hypothetical protein AB2805_08830 [Candidatus Thiodiazotropha sp.]
MIKSRSNQQIKIDIAANRRQSPQTIVNEYGEHAILYLVIYFSQPPRAYRALVYAKQFIGQLFLTPDNLP